MYVHRAMKDIPSGYGSLESSRPLDSHPSIDRTVVHAFVPSRSLSHPITLAPFKIPFIDPTPKSTNSRSPNDNGPPSPTKKVFSTQRSPATSNAIRVPSVSFPESSTSDNGLVSKSTTLHGTKTLPSVETPTPTERVPTSSNPFMKFRSTSSHTEGTGVSTRNDTMSKPTKTTEPSGHGIGITVSLPSEVAIATQDPPPTSFSTTVTANMNSTSLGSISNQQPVRTVTSELFNANTSSTLQSAVHSTAETWQTTKSHTTDSITTSMAAPLLEASSHRLFTRIGTPAVKTTGSVQRSSNPGSIMQSSATPKMSDGHTTGPKHSTRRFTSTMTSASSVTSTKLITRTGSTIRKLGPNTHTINVLHSSVESSLTRTQARIQVPETQSASIISRSLPTPIPTALVKNNSLVVPSKTISRSANVDAATAASTTDTMPTIIPATVTFSATITVTTLQSNLTAPSPQPTPQENQHSTIPVRVYIVKGVIGAGITLSMVFLLWLVYLICQKRKRRKRYTHLNTDRENDSGTYAPVGPQSTYSRQSSPQAPSRTPSTNNEYNRSTVYTDYSSSEAGNRERYWSTLLAEFPEPNPLQSARTTVPYNDVDETPSWISRLDFGGPEKALDMRLQIQDYLDDSNRASVQSKQGEPAGLAI